MPSRKFVTNTVSGVGNPDYLHYFYANVEEDIGLSGLHGLIEQSSQQIIKQHLSTLASRNQNLIANSPLDSSQKKAIEDMLSGQFFTGLTDSGAINMSSVNGAVDLDSALNFAVAQESLQNINQASDYITAFQDFCDAYFNANGMTNVWKAYADYLITDFANKKGLTESGEIATQIISSILSSNSGSFFTMVNKNGEKINSIISKIAIILRALPQSPEYSEALSGGKSDLKSEMVSKFKGWTSNLISIAAKYGFAVTTLDANQQLFEKMSQLNMTLEATGSEQVAFIPDSRQEQILSQINSALPKLLGKKASKSGLSFNVTKNNVSVSLGVNVKEATSKGATADTQKVFLKLQSSTPLATLLMRDVGLSGSQFDAVVQLAGGHGDTSSLDSTWDQLIEYATYACLLDAISNISVQENTCFFALNGKLYTISDILTHLGNTLDMGSQIWLSQDGASKSSGLQRRTYYMMNTWQKPDNPSKYAAEVKRSPQARQRILNAMYAAKITVNVNLAEYILLTQAALL